MFAIRLITLTALLLLAACGSAGSSAGGRAQAAETRQIGWDMLDGSAEPTAAGLLRAPNWCDGAGTCVTRD